MELSEDHRRFFRNDQFIHAFVINAVLNGGIAWAILRSHETVPLWGEGAMGPDLIITGILLPLLMCLIVSKVITGQVASGKLPPLLQDQIASRGMHRRPGRSGSDFRPYAAGERYGGRVRRSRSKRIRRPT